MTLLCAATKWEAVPLARNLGLKRISPNLFERPDRAIALLQTGMGRQKTTRSLQGWSASGGVCRTVLSTGFCGALQPGMRAGDIIADLGGCDAALVEEARRVAEARSLRLHFGRILHSDSVVCLPSRKEELGREQRASAVDMESAAVRQWAQGAGVASLCLRAVLDPMEQPMPEKPPQGEDFLSLLRYAVENLGQAPLLARVGYRQRQALASLCRFLAPYLEAL